MTARRRMRVAVIGGGQNCEYEVSLATARSVAAALDPERYDVVSLTIGRDGRWSDAEGVPYAGGLPWALAVIGGCDVVFPAVHGPRGEDGSLAALCELAGIPYVGSGVRAGALAMDKWATKLVAEALGIRTARGVLLTSADAPLPVWGPAVVKPVAAGSSFGVALVTDPARLAPAVTTALKYDDRVLVEELVQGREIDVSVLAVPGGGRRVGPPLEILTGDRPLFDTAAKYDGSADFRVPAPVTDAEGKSLTEASLDLFDALGCSGVARFDFFLTTAGPVLNEVNTMPGMTAQSQVPRIFAAAGLPYPRLLDMLVRGALETARVR